MENDGTVHRAAGLTAPSCSMVLTGITEKCLLAVNRSRWQEHSRDENVPVYGRQTDSLVKSSAIQYVRE